MQLDKDSSVVNIFIPADTVRRAAAQWRDPEWMNKTQSSTRMLVSLHIYAGIDQRLPDLYCQHTITLYTKINLSYYLTTCIQM